MPTYPAAVERWRETVSQYFRPEDVDKALWVIMHESGGRPDEPGDGGHAIGLFQHNDGGLASGRSLQALKDPVANIKLAAEAVYGGQGWKPWGENNLYKGEKFGALGSYPYPNPPITPPNTGGAGLTQTPPPQPPPQGGPMDRDTIAQQMFGKSYKDLTPLQQFKVDDEAKNAPKDANVGDRVSLRGPDGLMHLYEYNPQTKNFDIDRGVSQQATNPASERQPQGAISEGDLKQAGAKFGVGVATLGGKEYRKNADGTWSVSGNATGASQLSALQQSTNAYADVQKTLAGSKGGGQAGEGSEAITSLPAPAGANMRYAPTLDPSTTQQNQVYDPVKGAMVTTSLLTPEIGGGVAKDGTPFSGGRMTLDKGWSDTVLRTAGLLPSGDIDADMKAALAQDALRQKLWHEQGMNPLQAQTAIDAVNRGATTQERARSQQLQGDLLLRNQGIAPYKAEAPMSLAEMGNLLRPDFNDPYNQFQAEGGRNIAGTDEEMVQPYSTGNGFITPGTVGMFPINPATNQPTTPNPMAVAGEAGPEAINVEPLGPRPTFGMDDEELRRTRENRVGDINGSLGRRSMTGGFEQTTPGARFYQNIGQPWYGSGGVGKPLSVSSQMALEGKMFNMGKARDFAQQMLGYSTTNTGGAMSQFINKLQENPAFYESTGDFRFGGPAQMANGGMGLAGLPAPAMPDPYMPAMSSPLDMLPNPFPNVKKPVPLVDPARALSTMRV